MTFFAILMEKSERFRGRVWKSNLLKKKTRHHRIDEIFA